jgi:NAD(P)-dependent dehydrogenase (short-subunit alcohol dehydrogenase family)
MGRRLTGKVAVITGAGRGIGKAEALALAAEGARVVVNDFDVAADGTGLAKSPADDVVAMIKSLGGDAVANYDNVATPDGGENIIGMAVDEFGRLDILVNNAGFVRDRIIFKMSEEEWDTVIKVHLYGTFHCTRPACVIFRQQRGGRIINTSSSAGLGSLGMANYSAAKEGIIGFTRTVARDMGKYGVTCNAIRPIAATRMSLLPQIKDSFEKGEFQGLVKSLEEATPEMIAPLVVFLCTDAASNVNGCDLFVGGGRIGIYSTPEITDAITDASKVWTVDELVELLPRKITGKLVNPAPPQTPKG